MHKLFAYGTLMCEDIMTSVAGSAHSIGLATLEHFRRLEIVNEHYPGMVRSPRHVVEGMVYGNISDAALHKLDLFEGDMYERIQVNVRLRDGTIINVFTYIISPEYRHCLKPVDWDFDEFLASGKQAFQSRYAGYDKLPED